ncbi:MAG: exodeoxyribonuclease VII large subunit [Gemmatimonadota bacterium]|nr:exodeoxyribonuclease VII large subunit [Gemmatimonadota bacterium]
MRRSFGRPARAGAEYDLFGSSATSERVAPSLPGSTSETAIQVASLTETARAVIEGSLSPLWVRGEVSDFKRHRNGHWYFCLRDSAAQVRCVVWSRSQRGIPASPDEGMEVAAYGQLTVYAARGEMHLNVTAMDAVGDGLWRKAMEETRLRLEHDGLLRPERKRALPSAPTRVGMVTSPDGAALRDVISVIRRRAPHVSLVVSAATVQGPTAPAEIVAAIQRICRFGEIDVLIIGRGGGAREDLWAFNDESVARAICEAAVPVISGVGHEIDITIADLVADHRTATPSAAAEAAVPLRSDLLGALGAIGYQLRTSLQRCVTDSRRELEAVAGDLQRAASRDAERRRYAIAATAARLNALSPLATLSRGYAVARDAVDRRTLASVEDFAPGSVFTLTLRDGEIRATVLEDA